MSLSLSLLFFRLCVRLLSRSLLTLGLASFLPSARSFRSPFCHRYSARSPDRPRSGLLNIHASSSPGAPLFRHAQFGHGEASIEVNSKLTRGTHTDRASRITPRAPQLSQLHRYEDFYLIAQGSVLINRIILVTFCDRPPDLPGGLLFVTP